MTVSILETLATTPSGDVGSRLSLDELGKYLRDHCDTIEERQRCARHCLRDEIYRDGGVAHMHNVIDDVFSDPDVRRLRKAWVQHTRFTNPLKRVVNELATVYEEPATRFVDGAENNARYRQLLDDIGMDERMFHVSQLLNLHRAMLVRFRVRTLPDSAREPVLDWATPATTRVVLHPNDSTLPIGWLIRTSVRSARPDPLERPAWTLWTDHERVFLRDDFSVIESSYLEHKLGISPWIAVTLSPPGPGYWPGDEGEDLVAAAVSTWLSHVLLMKEQKSATKQETITGDGSTTARGQAADSEISRELSDGQSVSVTDMSMDLSMFRDTADHVTEHLAQNYGMSGAVITHQGVQSGEARELMRVPLHQLRIRQQTPLRRLERQLVVVKVAVLRADLPDRLFDPVGWGMQFGEPHTPLSRSEEIDLLVKERAAGTDSTIRYLMRRRRCTRDQAVEYMRENFDDEELRNEMIRPIAAMGGSTAASPTNPPANVAAAQNVQSPNPATAT